MNRRAFLGLLLGQPVTPSSDRPAWGGHGLAHIVDDGAATYAELTYRTADQRIEHVTLSTRIDTEIGRFLRPQSSQTAEETVLGLRVVRA